MSPSGDIWRNPILNGTIYLQAARNAQLKMGGDTPETPAATSAELAGFVKVVLSRDDLQFRLSSCQSHPEITALARATGFELELEDLQSLVDHPDLACACWPWAGRSRAAMLRFLELDGHHGQGQG